MHLVHQLFGDGHAQAGALVGSAAGLLLLGERLKDVLQKFLAHTDAGVGDLDAQVYQSFLEQGLAGIEVDGAAVGSVFDSVGQNV